jgi:peptidoglycan hydrolase-like protein with peptidoglycan-binding domain
MRKMIVTLLASSALAVPAFAATTTPPPKQQPQQQSQVQKPQMQQQSQTRPQNSQAENQKQASSKTVKPSSLDRSQIRQVQSALNRDGFKVGRIDGIWGPRTRDALESFQKSKGMADNGQLNHNTLAALNVKLNSRHRG